MYLLVSAISIIITVKFSIGWTAIEIALIIATSSLWYYVVSIDPIYQQQPSSTSTNTNIATVISLSPSASPPSSSKSARPIPSSSSSPLSSSSKSERPSSLSCLPSPIVKYRYCSICHKNIDGMDHHCYWLNTCIGSRNYKPFLLFVVIIIIQLIIQTIVSSLILLSSSLPLLRIILIFINIILSSILNIPLLILLVFHGYLIFLAKVS